MANTNADNYIETLTLWSEIEMEVGICTITNYDQYKCTVVDDQWDIYEYDWGQVAECWDSLQASDKEDADSNAWIDYAKSF